MGLMDNITGKTNDSMRDRYEELKMQAQNGELSDEGRNEYEQLRSRFETRDNT
jgi:hypothetical protein